MDVSVFGKVIGEQLRSKDVVFLVARGVCSSCRGRLKIMGSRVRVQVARALRGRPTWLAFSLGDQLQSMLVKEESQREVSEIFAMMSQVTRKPVIVSSPGWKGHRALEFNILAKSFEGNLPSTNRHQKQNAASTSTMPHYETQL